MKLKIDHKYRDNEPNEEVIFGLARSEHDVDIYINGKLAAWFVGNEDGLCLKFNENLFGLMSDLKVFL